MRSYGGCAVSAGSPAESLCWDPFPTVWSHLWCGRRSVWTHNHRQQKISTTDKNPTESWTISRSWGCILETMTSPVRPCPVCRESAGIFGGFSCRCQEPQSWGFLELQWSWSPTQTLCGWPFCVCQHTEKLARYRLSPGVSMTSWELCNCTHEGLSWTVECNSADWQQPFCGPTQNRLGTLMRR